MPDWRAEVRERLSGVRIEPAREAGIVEELAAHLEDCYAEHRAGGASEEQARKAALAELEESVFLRREIEKTQRAARLEPPVLGAEGSANPVFDLFHDSQYGLRMMLKNRGATAVAVVTLALGIGANVAVFTLMHALLLRALPVSNPRDLVILQPRVRGEPGFISFPMYRDLRAHQQVFTDILATAGETPVRLTIPGGSGTHEVDNVRTSFVTANYFPLLGVQPALGRFFTEDEDRDPQSSQRAGSLAVLSYPFWERQFGCDPKVLGRSIVVQRSECRIVGVAPRGFYGEVIGMQPDLWVPLVSFSSAEMLENRRGAFTTHVGRLKPGIPRERAESAMTALFRRLVEAERAVQPPGGAHRDADSSEYSLRLEPGATGVRYPVHRTFTGPIRILMGIVALVLLIACANIANLQLARAASRQREIGVRLALGCNRARLVRQLLTESVLLSSLGSLAGVGVAFAGCRFLLRMVDTGPLPLQLDLSPDASVLVFAAGVTIGTGIAFGSAPAWRSSSIDVASALKEQGRSTAGASLKQYVGRTLVASQVALSLLLLIGAGLLVRSLLNLRRIDLGFRPESVLVFDLGHNPSDRDPAVLARVARRVHERVREVPGVHSASLSGLMLFSPSDISAPIRFPASSRPIGELVPIRFSSVSPHYFATVGMALLAGRDFDDLDKLDSSLVAVVNESMARRYFDGEPLDRRIEINVPAYRGKPVRVVGVVGDSKYNNLRAEVKPMFYMPIQQLPRSLRSLEVRTDQPAAALLEPIRRALLDASRDIMIRRVIPLATQVDRTLAAERLIAMLGSLFGALALLLAGVGLYGRDVLWMVLRQSLTVVLVGVAMGIPAALLATRFLASFLYGLSPSDPPTMLSATAFLVLVALCAALVPARRAARLDPMVALRHE